MKKIRPTILMLALFIATIPLTAAKCDKNQLVAAAQDVVDVVTNKELLTALQTISPPLLRKLEAITPSAKELITAIRNGDTSNALALVNTIFPVIDEVAASLGANQKMMAILALANIGLHFIINHVQTTAPAAASAAALPDAQTAINFGNQRVWGCDFKKDKRCDALAH